MQGMNVSLQVTLTSFKGRDSKPAAPSDGPAPLPEDGATGEETEEETESNEEKKQ